jgi:hypothetical protein
MSNSKKEKEDWMQRKWRPAMAMMYMVVCVFDFILFPIMFTIVQFWEVEAVNDAFRQWQPLTLIGAGLFHMAMGAVRYSVNIQQEALNYTMKAYEAHLKGATEVAMPVKLASVNDLDEHHRRMEKVMSLTKLSMMYESKTGYCLHVQPDEKIVCYSLVEDTVHKHASIDELPKDVAEKFAMFKILPENDAYEHLGVKLKDNMFFIVQ